MKTVTMYRRDGNTTYCSIILPRQDKVMIVGYYPPDLLSEKGKKFYFDDVAQAIRALSSIGFLPENQFSMN